MEKEIKKLIELAEKYAEFGKKIGLIRLCHHDLSINEKIKIIIYYTDSGNYSIEFPDKIVIDQYLSKIVLPFSATIKTLNNTYKIASDFFENGLKQHEFELIKAAREKREAEISNLEKLIEKLKNNL